MFRKYGISMVLALASFHVGFGMAYLMYAESEPAQEEVSSTEASNPLNIGEKFVKASADIWEDTRPKEGPATIWGDVLPQVVPLDIVIYDPEKDIRLIRPTYDNGGKPLVGCMSVKSITSAYMNVVRPLNEWIFTWRETGEGDCLYFWRNATEYTNYVENLGLTKFEASQIAEQARKRAIEVIAEYMASEVDDEGPQSRAFEILSLCHMLLLSENDTGYTKGQVASRVSQSIAREDLCLEVSMLLDQACVEFQGKVDCEYFVRLADDVASMSMEKLYYTHDHLTLILE